MEFAEAGVQEYPQVSLSASSASNHHASEVRASRSEKEERRLRKEDRARRRAAKEARREQRERRQSSSATKTVEEDSSSVWVPSSGVPASGSRIPVSASPFEDCDHRDPAGDSLDAGNDRDDEIRGRESDGSTAPSSPKKTSKATIPVKRPSHRQARNTEKSQGSSKPTKRPCDSDIDNGNAEAGPSTPNAVVRDGKSTPRAKPAKRARTPARQSSTPFKTRDGEEVSFSRQEAGDEDLRQKLSDPDAAQDFLVARFWPPPYLNRLEAAVIKMKKGKLDLPESRAIRKHLEVFRATYRLDEDQLVDIIMGKGKGNAREDYPDFWHGIALEIPGRPLRSVVKVVQRMYDPRGRKGPWTKDEDAELIRAHRVHPSAWTKIAAIVERTEQDCRDRWNKEIANADKRNTGPWTLAEEADLIQAIREANHAIGSEVLAREAPWDVVAAKLGFIRGPTQCRRKWHMELYHRENGLPLPEKTVNRAKPTAILKKGEARSPNIRKFTPKRKAPVYKSQQTYDSELEDESDDHDEPGKAGHAVSDDSEREDIEVDPTPLARVDDSQDDAIASDSDSGSA